MFGAFNHIVGTRSIISCVKYGLSHLLKLSSLTRAAKLGCVNTRWEYTVTVMTDLFYLMKFYRKCRIDLLEKKACVLISLGYQRADITLILSSHLLLVQTHLSARLPSMAKKRAAACARRQPLRRHGKRVSARASLCREWTSMGMYRSPLTARFSCAIWAPRRRPGKFMSCGLCVC